MKPGRYIRKHRLKAGISLRQLAQTLEVSHVFLGALEREVKKVPDRLVDKLASAVDGIKASRLRKLIRDDEPVCVEITPAGGSERDLALAFARKAQHGFSRDEVKALWDLLRED